VNVIEKLPWYFNLCRPLFRVPSPGSAIKAMYLTHLEVERELPPTERRKLFAELFGFMATQAWDKEWHMVSFCDFPSVRLGDGLRGFFKQEVPMKLFTVRPAGAGQLAVDSKAREEPGFEIALV
jgi:hypothetical protein